MVSVALFAGSRSVLVLLALQAGAVVSFVLNVGARLVRCAPRGGGFARLLCWFAFGVGFGPLRLAWVLVARGRGFICP